MAVVELKKNLTVEDIFDAIYKKAGELDTARHAEAFRAFMAVTHAIMVDGMPQEHFGALGLEIKHMRRTH